MQRKSYDTAIKHLIRLNLQNGIPPRLLKSIPRTNIDRWRKEPPSKYEGFQLNIMAKQELELLQEFSEHRKIKQSFRAYLRLLSVCRSIVRKNRDLRTIFFDSREDLVDVIQRVSTSIGIAKAVKLLGISRTTFQNWLLETKVKCNYNYFGWCNRVRPFQLSEPEVLAIRRLVTDERFYFWPISSIYHYALRERTVHTSLSTFYKYVRLLGIKRVRFKKPPPRSGIRATQVHELWHTDITILKLEGRKLYLHLLMDNYSRYILGWKLADRPSGLTVRNMLSEALEKYRPGNVRLLVDGGSENNNNQVDQLIDHSNGKIHKLIAQKQIYFSNSMVESAHRLLKTNYLRPMGIDKATQLLPALQFSIDDINHKRPHNAIGGLIPVEALNGIAINTTERKQQIQIARVERLEFNRKNSCKKCF